MYCTGIVLPRLSNGLVMLFSAHLETCHHRWLVSSSRIATSKQRKLALAHPDIPGMVMMDLEGEEPSSSPICYIVCANKSRKSCNELSFTELS